MTAFAVALGMALSSGAFALDATSGASLRLEDMQFPVAESPPEPMAFSSGPAKEGDFWIAFEDTGRDEVFRQSLLPLVQQLRASFPQRQVVVTRIPSATFVSEVRRRNIPFLLATSGTMVSLVLDAGAVPIASRGTVAGALVVVRAQDHARDLSALEGRVLASAASSGVFGPKAWLDVELARAGFEPDRFWRRVERRARALPDVFAALESRRADAALLPGCLWERLAAENLLDASRYRPLLPEGEAPGAASAGEQGRLDAGRCLSTTARYPEWMMGYMPTADDETLRRLAAATFRLQGDAMSRWGFRVDLSAVRAGMEQLRLGPYAALAEQTLTGFLAAHKDWFFGLLLVLATLLLHAMRANYLVRVKTAALRRALEERDRMEEEAKRGRERLSAAERAGILSQMSGMFAHELKQPLAAVRNYVGGLRLRAKMKPGGDAASDELALEVLERIDEEAARAAGIVERVRGYAKAESRRHGATDLAAAIRRAVDYAQRHDSRCAPVTIVPGAVLAQDGDDAAAMVWGDALELELLVLNLVRNASHAVSGVSGAQVWVSLLVDEGLWFELRVEDNGPALSDESFRRLSGLGDSIKREGLGIGLIICRGIVDRHGAALRFERLEPCGVRAVVRLPVLTPEARRQFESIEAAKTSSDGILQKNTHVIAEKPNHDRH